MAQSPLTVTAPNPTPPTNFSFTGATPPNPATFDPTVYGPPWRPDLAPYFDDGTAGPLDKFAAKHAALAVGGTSVDHEGLGTEVTVVVPGSRPECPTLAVSTDGPYTITPNASHPSCLSSPAAATIGSLSAGGASGAGTTALTVTGTNFTRASVVNVNGVPQTTNYASPTSLTVAAAPKKPTAGNLPVTVVTQGQPTAPTNWTFT